MSDEEFYARIRQRLENHPEPPPQPAAWRSMESLLNADAQKRQLRHQLLRSLGLEVLGVFVLLSLALKWALPVEKAASSSVVMAHQAAAPASRGGVGPAVAARPRPPVATRGGREKALPSGLLPAAGAAPTAGTAGTTPAAGNLLSPSASGGQPAMAPARRDVITPTPRPAAGEPLVATARRGKVGTELALERSDNQHKKGFEPGRQPISKAAVSAPAKVASWGGVAGSQQGQAARALPLAGTGFGRPAGSRPVTSGEKLTTNYTPRRAKSLAEKTQLASAKYAENQTYKSKKDFTKPSPSAAKTALAATRPAPKLAPGQALGVVDSLALAAARRPPPHLPLPDSLKLAKLAPRGKPADELPAPKPASGLAAYRVRVGLVVAPELSSVRSGPFTTPGSDVGLLAEYQLARRWHVSAGYLVATKRYVAEGADYRQSPGYYIKGLQTVDANCRVIDIPLNLRYDVWQRPTQQVFVSAGLSSLLMRREDYTYHFDVAGQPQTSNWELLNGSRHFFQILNLSAGYERALGTRWSAQAEPFMKFPLNGLGFGAVRLSSAGIFFSLKFGLFPAAKAAPPVAR